MASTRCELARVLCRQFPKAATQTLAKRLHDEHPALFTSIDTARDTLRHCRGNKGDRSRRHNRSKELIRPNGKAGQLPPLPPSEDQPWEPFELDTRRSLVLGDLHIPFHSLVAIKAALAFADEWKPDTIFINGDLFDFYHLSRFDKKPTLPKVSAELLAGGKFLDHLTARFPRAKKFFKLGNHDERWAKYLFAVAPLLADIPEVQDSWLIPAGIQRNKVTVITDQRPVMLGKLPVFHGHELGKGIASPVNPARGAFLRAMHTVAVNHHHRSSGHADTNIWHDEIFAWSIACLCGLSPEYARVNRWNWGFAAVEVYKDGSFDVQNMRIEKNGKVRAS